MAIPLRRIFEGQSLKDRGVDPKLIVMKFLDYQRSRGSIKPTMPKEIDVDRLTAGNFLSSAFGFINDGFLSRAYSTFSNCRVKI